MQKFVNLILKISIKQPVKKNTFILQKIRNIQNLSTQLQLQLLSTPTKVSPQFQQKFKFTKNSIRSWNVQNRRIKRSHDYKTLFQNSVKKKKKNRLPVERLGIESQKLLISSGAFVLLVVSAAIKRGSQLVNESPFAFLGRVPLDNIAARVEGRIYRGGTRSFEDILSKRGGGKNRKYRYCTV